MEPLRIQYIIGTQEILSLKLKKGLGAIYAYICDGKIYVGQTRKSMRVRHKQHLNHKLVIDLKIQNNPFELFLLWVGPVSELDSMEKYYIQRYNSMWPNGWNMSDGGANTFVLSEESRRKLSEIAKAQGRKPPGMQGKPHPSKGTHLTPEQNSARIQKILENHPDFFKKHAAKLAEKSGKDHYRSIPVYQRDRDGTIIARFVSTTEASKITGVCQSDISCCIRGIHKTAGGYIWTYTEESAERLGTSIDIPKLTKIQQFDLDDNLIAEYKNTVDAAAAVGKHPRDISKVICGFNKTSAGYKWKKVEID